MDAMKIDTDDEARAWLIEHVAEPAEALNTALPAFPTFLQVLIAHASAYKIAPRQGADRPILDKLRAFHGPERSLAMTAARLISMIRADAYVGYMGACAVGLPASDLPLTVRHLKLTGIGPVVAWLAALDLDECALRRPAMPLPAVRCKRRRTSSVSRHDKRRATNGSTAS